MQPPAAGAVLFLFGVQWVRTVTNKLQENRRRAALERPGGETHQLYHAVVAGSDALLCLLVHRRFRDQFWTKLYCSELDTLTRKASCRCRIRLRLNRCSRHDRASAFLANSELLSCGFPLSDRLISPADSSRGPSYVAKYLRGKTVDRMLLVCNLLNCWSTGTRRVQAEVSIGAFTCMHQLAAAQQGAMCDNCMWSVTSHCRKQQ